MAKPSDFKHLQDLFKLGFEGQGLTMDIGHIPQVLKCPIECYGPGYGLKMGHSPIG